MCTIRIQIEWGTPEVKKATIIIPAKNVSMYIEDCLKSCSDRNNINNIKIIIINDASDDETGIIIENYKKNNSNFDIDVIVTQGIGAAACRNLALDIAESEYIAFVDGDDLISIDALNKITSLMNESGADICIPRTISFDNGKLWEKEFDFPSLKKKINREQKIRITNCAENPEILSLETSMCMRVYRLSFLHENGIRFQEINFCEDVYPSRLSFLVANKIAVYLGDPYYYYRNNRLGQRTSIKNESTMDLIEVIKSIIDMDKKIKITNIQGRYIINNIIRLVKWSITLVPESLVKSYTHEVSKLLLQMPSSWTYSNRQSKAMENQENKIIKAISSQNITLLEKRLLGKRLNIVDKIVQEFNIVRKKLKSR